MGKFSGVLVLTDLDGTLLQDDKTISVRNREAIEFFKSEGGIFTFVTGRLPSFVYDIYTSVKPNAAIGCINGGGLYDYEKNKYIYTADMPSGVFELVKNIDKNFPNVGIQVNTYDTVYFCKENETMENFRKLTKLPNIVCRYDCVTEPVAKIVFGSESDEEIAGIEKILKSHPLASKFDFVRSERTLYDILPKGIGKHVAVEKLAKILNVGKTVAIGDYDNDVSMLKVADVGVAVSNACKQALEAADYITVSNEEDAVAQVIYDLADKKI